MQHHALEQQGFHDLAQRLELRPEGPDPFRQRRARDRRRGPAKDLFLALEPHVIRILRHQHLREKTSVGIPLPITCGGTGAWINVTHRSGA